jgi:hypothetical protein
MLGLEPFGLRRSFDQVTGRIKDGAGGSAKLEPVITEHNENALGAGRKRLEFEREGGGHRRALAVPWRDGPGLVSALGVADREQIWPGWYRRA